MLQFLLPALRQISIIVAVVFGLPGFLLGQEQCVNSIGSIYGDNNQNEQGKCLVPTADSLGFYVAGYKEDSVLLLKIDLTGKVEWARTFDIITGERHDVNTILLDSEGMLGIAGTTGGTVPGNTLFVFRYDPIANTMLWVYELISAEKNESYSLIQKGPGGNYILTNNPSHISVSNDDCELLEINKDNGTILPAFSKNYHVASSEHLLDLVYYEDFIYGCGRFTAPGVSAGFRHTLAKFDSNDGTIIWSKMGHVPAASQARLYGFDLVIDQDEIYSLYYGDPSGTSLINTNIYIQKTDLDGNLIWLKQYDHPGPGDYAHELIKSENGYVILSSTLAEPDNMVLFKIDSDGDVLWANSIHFSGLFSSIQIARASSQLIQIGDNLIFTGSGTTNTGNTELIIVRTDLEGQLTDACTGSNPLNISAIDVVNPVFFSVTPDQFSVSPTLNIKSLEATETSFSPIEECIISDTIMSTLSINLCNGQTHEGYSSSGTYIDTFINDSGCDSIRTLHLRVISCEAIVHYNLDACRSYMDDGSHMDYSEFIPAYPTVLPCAQVSAGILHRDPSQKHSCTPGIAGSPAMCVTTLNSCTYMPGNEASVVIEVTINPSQDSVVMFTGLEFYEKSPGTYTWIDGDSGPNNYPRFYGIRILKNGSEIFRQINIGTTTNWSLQSFDFISNDLFRVEDNTIFRIELLPYCPVGNGALVSAWDIDEFKIFGGCVPVVGSNPIIIGQVRTKTGKELSDIEMILSDNHSFTSSVNSFTDPTGQYLFENLDETKKYYLKGYKNDDVLNGVSTLDIIHIQKHLLGKEPFTSLHQYIAADVNRSNHVNTVDILDLRKLLLGLYSEFPRNTSWRFGPLPQDFTALAPEMFEEIENLESLTHDMTVVEFVGIKIGDLNNDARSNASEISTALWNSDLITMRAEDRLVEAGVPFKVDILAGNVLMMAGIQFSLEFKNAKLVEVKQGTLPIADEHFIVSDDGILRLSWNQPEAINISHDDVLFTLTVIANKTGRLSDYIVVLKDGLQPEVYRENEHKSIPLTIEFYKSSQTLSDENFLRIEPNPVHHSATVRFYLVREGQAILRFFDISGKPVYEFEKTYLQGEHSVVIEIDKLPAAKGVIYCQLITNGGTIVRKVAIMN